MVLGASPSWWTLLDTEYRKTSALPVGFGLTMSSNNTHRASDSSEPGGLKAISLVVKRCPDTTLFLVRFQDCLHYHREVVCPANTGALLTIVSTCLLRTDLKYLI